MPPDTTNLVASHTKLFSFDLEAGSTPKPKPYTLLKRSCLSVFSATHPSLRREYSCFAFENKGFKTPIWVHPEISGERGCVNRVFVTLLGRKELINTTSSSALTAFLALAH
ncbi:hypothetical protein M408DRAFT_331543 [Serendipita vermifera MAFF 305830]|uniref:Uncharacterized protein n=1 Tax=Serendipita vermifera MAFF 305830 TaxID=933852 RepID=A0A0C2WEI9_SERVB|nr:hypothetical protein M408DRAFT_331543 [Serendipita vermifera MAFF 305830]